LPSNIADIFSGAKAVGDELEAERTKTQQLEQRIKELDESVAEVQKLRKSVSTAESSALDRPFFLDVY
jgi:cell division septum initiation protein DivIVA